MAGVGQHLDWGEKRVGTGFVGRRPHDGAEEGLQGREVHGLEIQRWGHGPRIMRGGNGYCGEV